MAISSMIMVVFCIQYRVPKQAKAKRFVDDQHFSHFCWI